MPVICSSFNSEGEHYGGLKQNQCSSSKFVVVWKGVCLGIKENKIKLNEQLRGGRFQHVFYKNKQMKATQGKIKFLKCKDIAGSQMPYLLFN